MPQTMQTHNEGRNQIRINKKKTVNTTNLHDLILKCSQDRNDEKEKKENAHPCWLAPSGIPPPATPADLRQ